MLRPIACLSILPMLLSLLSYSCVPLKENAWANHFDSLYKEKKDSTLYTNLTGKKIYALKDSNHRKMIVLTTSLKDTIIRESILANEVLDYPSWIVIDSMELSLKKAEKAKGKEQFFIVGKKRRISLICEGTREEIDRAASERAKYDLNNMKRDSTAYHIHTHGYRESSDSLPYFTFTPSSTDTSSQNFKERIGPDVILSYRVDTIDIDTGNRFKLGGEKDPKNIRYTYVPVIVFYAQKGPIATQDLSDFKKLIKKE